MTTFEIRRTRSRKYCAELLRGDELIAAIPCRSFFAFKPEEVVWTQNGVFETAGRAGWGWVLIESDGSNSVAYLELRDAPLEWELIQVCYRFDHRPLPRIVSRERFDAFPDGPGRVFVDAVHGDSVLRVSEAWRDEDSKRAVSAFVEVLVPMEDLRVRPALILSLVATWYRRHL